MGPIHWHCHECFHGMREADTAGGIVVVIDVLRASTTIVTALANGAIAVRAEQTAEAARFAADLAGRDAGACLLGGERGGLRIEGFDLGNSPREYTRARVAGRRIVTTTTNGTAAVAACPRAEAILIGALVNRRAAATRSLELAVADGGPPRPIHLVCAGTDGEVTEEDLIAAGAIVDAARTTSLDAAAAAARDHYRRTIRGADDPRVPLAAALAAARGGRNLVAIGMAADIGDAAAIDAIPVVPHLVVGSGWFQIDP